MLNWSAYFIISNFHINIQIAGKTIVQCYSTKEVHFDLALILNRYFTNCPTSKVKMH